MQLPPDIRAEHPRKRVSSRRISKPAHIDGAASSTSGVEEGERQATAAKISWKQLKLRADKLTRRSSEQWEANLAALQAFVHENDGRYPRPGEATEPRSEEQSLAAWCNHQRVVRWCPRRVYGALGAARVQQLEQVRGWSWGAATGAEFRGQRTAGAGALEKAVEEEAAAAAESSWKHLVIEADKLTQRSGERWEAKLAALRAFVEENGGYPSRDRPRSSAWAEERKLANWRDTQRRARPGTNSGRGILSTTQVQQLQTLRGWSWSVAERSEASEQAESSWKQRKLFADSLPKRSSERWEANLAALQAYMQENEGRHPRRSSACAEERKLGNWREQQRQVRRGTSEGVLSAAQVRQLKQLRGWSWGAAGAAESGEEEAGGQEAQEEALEGKRQRQVVVKGEETPAAERSWRELVLEARVLPPSDSSPFPQTCPSVPAGAAGRVPKHTGGVLRPRLVSFFEKRKSMRLAS